jgi:integrase
LPDITIGRLRGGFSVHWLDPQTGKRRRYQLAARSRAEAESEARERYLKETWSAGSDRVSDLWQAYILHLGDKPTAKTMGYTGTAILPFFGALRPSQITVEDCRRYKQQRLAAGRKIGTVWTELGHLRSTLNFSHKMGLVDRVPYIELPPKPDSNVRPIEGKDLQQIIDAASAPHIKLALVLLVSTGARVGAILDLTWERIDFDRGVIDLRLPDGVTRKGRAVVPMNRMARAALQSAYPSRLTDHVVEWAGDRVHSIRTGYKAALQRAGMASLGIHQIRHSVAVRMFAAGMPIEKVSQFLGHSNILITQKVYARFLPDHLADAAEVLDLGFIEPARTSQKRRK